MSFGDAERASVPFGGAKRLSCHLVMQSDCRIWQWKAIAASFGDAERVIWRCKAIVASFGDAERLSRHLAMQVSFEGQSDFRVIWWV